MARDSWFLPLLARILALRRSEALSLGTLKSFEQYLRFAALFSLSVVLPAAILVTLALRSIRAEELQVDAELDRRAETLAIDVYTELQDSFERFEAAATDRLMRGQSPLANLAELSPYLRAAFRFDAEGRLVAPFELSETVPPREPTTAYVERWTAGSRAERAGSWDLALTQYRAAAQITEDPALAGEAEYAAARVLWRAGRAAEAELALADLYADYGNLRDRWGFRVGDLAALLRAQIALERSPDVGQVGLEGLVEQILSDRWTAGHPGEAAVARRSLALLEGHSDPDWLGRARIRLGERTTQLYWADQLLEQLEPLAAEAPRAPSGQFRYEVRSDLLWATLPWDDSLYAFSFDYGALVGELRATLLRSADIDEEIFAQILPITDQTPGGTLRRQTLAPWAPSHTVVVGLADPGSILAKKVRMRRTRIVVIGLALAMSVLGVLLSLRLVRNELESARVKTDFAANVSHELRSPITQIRLKAESLQLDLVFDESDRRAHHDAIVREAERLSRLVDNVLDFAAIERGAKRYAPRPEDLEAILGQAVESARSDFESKDVIIELSVPDDLPVVWCDREAIAQVMTNLLSNAAKYGSEAGWVGVRARPAGDVVEIAVSDRGIGIAPADLDHVFDHFFRSGDPNVRRRKGTGIGLSIVRYIVEAHGGTITVDSTPGHGSTFTFTLPMQPPAEGAT